VAVETRIHEVEHAVRRETGSWVEPAGRIGLASQGILYLIVGVLALEVARGHGEDRADQHGAIQAVAAQSFGRLLLVMLTIGLAMHAVWRALLFARGSPGEDDATDWAKRLGHLGRAAVYVTFTWGALVVLFGSEGDTGGEQQEGIAKVLSWPGGSLVVAAVGLAVVGTGVWHGRKALTRSFVDDLDCDRIGQRAMPAVMALGVVGTLARGIAFGLVGWFVVQAARDDDPDRGGGLDHALKRLADADYGPALLRVLAVGVVTFGLYRIVEAVFRSRQAVANA
jgi:hypothetical protein